MPGRKKSLLIGINYTGSSHQLAGCVNDAWNIRRYLTEYRGFSDNTSDMVMLTDIPDNSGTAYEPTGVNILAAINWLVTGNPPGSSLFISYSGHGSQVKDPDGDRESGLDDTICPVDFERHGQITSDTLHRALVSTIPPYCRMTILFDCCHSGSAVELPYVYRPDSQGNINLMDNVKKGMSLVAAASDLMRGGFNPHKIEDAKMLLGGATSFFKGLQHRGEPSNEDGLGEEHFVENWKGEGKDVWMFSGCADDQTSADTQIFGQPTGAMSWAFIKTMKDNPRQSYVNVLQNTRVLIRQKYQQIPQLSVGGEYDLDQLVSF